MNMRLIIFVSCLILILSQVKNEPGRRNRFLFRNPLIPSDFHQQALGKNSSNSSSVEVIVVNESKILIVVAKHPKAEVIIVHNPRTPVILVMDPLAP